MADVKDMTEEAFNGLTPAQAERLAMLAEEAAEVIQIVGKILRHGLDSYPPGKPYLVNTLLLEKELCDFDAVRRLMTHEGDINPFGEDGIQVSLRKKMQYAHHQRSDNG